MAKGKKKKKDPNAPKRPMSAYLLYSKAHLKDIKAANPDKDHRQCVTLLSEQWKSLDAATKDPFVNKAKALMDKYKQDTEEYKKNKPTSSSSSSSSSSSDAKQKKKKRKRDDTKPKRAPTAYILYGKANRARLKAENPDAQNKDMFGIISAAFKALSPEEKAPYVEEAAKAKEKYDAEMAQWRLDNPVQKKQKNVKGKKKKKDPNAPKRARSAYIFFMSEKRGEIAAANPSVTNKEVFGLVGAAFKALSPEDRAIYDQKAAKDKERYAKEMESYQKPSSSSSSSSSSSGGSSSSSGGSSSSSSGSSSGSSS